MQGKLFCQVYTCSHTSTLHTLQCLDQDNRELKHN